MRYEARLKRKDLRLSLLLRYDSWNSPIWHNLSALGKLLLNALKLRQSHAILMGRNVSYAGILDTMNTSWSAQMHPLNETKTTMIGCQLRGLISMKYVCSYD